MHLTLPHPLALWRRPTLSERAIGWGVLTMWIVLSSMSTSFSKQLTTIFSPLSLLFLSEFLTWAFTVLSFGFIPLVREVLKLKRPSLLPLLCVGITSSVIAPLMAFTGLMTTKAMNAELYLRSDTLFIVILAIIVLREKIRPIHAIAGALIFLGLLVVALRGFTEGLTYHSGDLLLVGAAIVYSSGTILFKKYLTHTHADVVVFVRTSLAISCFFLLSPFIENPLITELSLFHVGLVTPLVGYAFFSRFLGLFCFYESIERLPVRTVSLLMPMAIVGSIVFAWLYLGETLRLYNIIGGLLIIAGAVLVRLEHLFEKKDPIPLDAQLEQQHRQHL